MATHLCHRRPSDQQSVGRIIYLIIMFTLVVLHGFTARADEQPSQQNHPGVSTNQGIHSQNNLGPVFYYNNAHPLAVQHYVFRHADVAQFNRDDLAHWQAGYWNNTCLTGRCGWWWLAGGVWYFYPQPVYPYPPYRSAVTAQN